ncbi:helix-turn-helix domain-containing protein [Planctomycetota bacterium]
MEISIRLNKLLAEHGLAEYGIIQEIASDIDVDRHTIAKLYNNRTASVSLDLLGKVCTWLESHHVPARDLPGALFSRGRAGLWEAIACEREEVTLYLGEYQSINQPSPASRWIASSDMILSARVLQQLSMGTAGGSAGPQLKLAHIPFHYAPNDASLDSRHFEEDKHRAGEVFKELKARTIPDSTIIIGSQRVNYLLEYFVADLFGCKPFLEVKGKPAVPFFCVYRDTDQRTPSCFGDSLHRYRQKDHDVPGIHYINANGNWATCPWISDQHDAGVVITLHDHRRKAITLAAFGFTGRATEAVGEQLVNKEQLFWPPATQLTAMDVGVYICELTYPQPSMKKKTSLSTDSVDCEIIPLHDRRVRQYTS